MGSADKQFQNDKESQDGGVGQFQWQAGDSLQCVPRALCPCDTARAQAALGRSVYKLLEFLPSAYSPGTFF